MKILKFPAQLPEWCEETSGNFRSDNLHRVFRALHAKDFDSMLDLKCRCCDSRMDLAYYGFNDFLPSERGNDTSIQFTPYYHEPLTDGKANNIAVDALQDGHMSKIITFFEITKKAIEFKQETIKGICFLLEFSLFKSDDLKIIVRQDEGIITFILYRLGSGFMKVPLIAEAETYRECLGIVQAIETKETILEATKEDFKKSLHMAQVHEWIDLLLKENDMNPIENKKIWIRHYP